MAPRNEGHHLPPGMVEVLRRYRFTLTYVAVMVTLLFVMNVLQLMGRV